jgi:hypothetical protein
METKEPVLLIVLVESTRLRWFTAALGFDGVVSPLLCSEAGDLATYQGLDFDEQTSFLRHRFCNVLQRGCDRLWPVGKKAAQFVFLFEGALPDTTEELTLRVAEHFVMWLLDPPVVVFTSEGGFDSSPEPRLHRLAGEIDCSLADVLQNGLVPLFALATDLQRWEVSNRKGTWRPGCEPA